MRDILKNFYETIKANDEYLHFALLTGVSKFSKTSIFSTLNNLNDITLDERYSKIVGIDEKQLYIYFSDRITLLADKFKITEDELKNEIRNWYNGYSWDGKNFIYNPYSLLSLFEKQKINNYWFSSGTPSYLIKQIKKYDISIENLENYLTDDSFFESYDIDKMQVQSLLFQTGYLTIKDIEEISFGIREYSLSYPNLEVKESLLKHILTDFTETQSEMGVIINRLAKSLNQNDLESFFKYLKSLFSSIPSNIFIKDKEAYYHTIIYLVLTLIGVRIETEVHTNKGRIDAVIKTSDNIYIFEFKMNNEIQAIKQIKEKEYYEKYLSSEKKIIFVGVSFDFRDRNIKNWKSELLNMQ